MARDPVCGMEVAQKQATAQTQYQGKTYYFCSPGCKAAFQKDPAKYAGPPAGQGGHGHAGH